MILIVFNKDFVTRVWTLPCQRAGHPLRWSLHFWPRRSDSSLWWVHDNNHEKNWDKMKQNQNKTYPGCRRSTSTLQCSPSPQSPVLTLKCWHKTQEVHLGRWVVDFAPACENSFFELLPIVRFLECFQLQWYGSINPEFLWKSRAPVGVKEFFMIHHQDCLCLVFIIEARWSNEDAFCCIQTTLLFIFLIILLRKSNLLNIELEFR